MKEHRQREEQSTAQPTDPRLLLTVAEVATMTGLSKWTIYRRIKSGAWPSGRSGRRHLIPRKFIEGLVTEIEAGRQVVVEGYAATSWPAKAVEGAA